MLFNQAKPERCSTKPFCEHLRKIKGTYHCALTNEEVDNGDEEDGSDYIFIRTKSCRDEKMNSDTNEAKWREVKRFKARTIPEFDEGKFWIRVSKSESCWNWVGATSGKGYGTFTIQGKNYLAHRISYKLHNEQPNIHMVVDHICRNKMCVNPTHLRLVTHKVNALENSQKADLRARKECKNGHSLDEKNSYINKYGARDCRKCKADRELRRKYSNRVKELEDELEKRTEEQRLKNEKALEALDKVKDTLSRMFEVSGREVYKYMLDDIKEIKSALE